MEETGLHHHRFHQQAVHNHHRNLDPCAQEFFPTPAAPPLLPAPQIYYSFPSPPPPPYAPPFCDFSAPLAYVGSSGGAMEQPPPQPPAVMMVRPSYVPPPPMLTPTRALLLTQVPADVSESIVRRDLEVFGEVRAVQMDRVLDGAVTVHFYDLRHAQTALLAIQEQHMQNQCRVGLHYEAVLAHHNSPPASFVVPPPLPPPARGLISGRTVWAQFTIPGICKIPDGCNQGTLVLFNLDPSLSSPALQQIFQAYGQVRELRDTPTKKNQRFVEFYDVRDAAKALNEMNGKEISGRRIVIEFSRPGGFTKRYANNGVPPPLPPPPPPHGGSTHNYSPPFSTPTQRKPSGYRSTSRKSSFSRNPNNGRCTSTSGGGSSSSSSIQESMASMRINNTNNNGNGFDAESCSSKLKPCKSSKKAINSNSSSGSNNSCSSSTSTSKSSSRLWKNSSRLQHHQGKEYDPRFLINEDSSMESSNCKDPRTTVMIKNIPNKYSQKLLLNMLDNHCIHCNEQIADGDDQPLSSYDFVYLPIDFINKCNVGYGFVNMTSPEATLRLYKTFHHGSWEVFNSRKICEVTYARLQGVDALREHFKNSKFPYEAEEYMPVVFSPPRDGRQLTEPVPIVARSSTNPPPGGPPPPPLLLSSSSAISSSQENTSETSIEEGRRDFLEQEMIIISGSDIIDGTAEQNNIYDDDDDGCGRRSSNGGGDSGGDYYDNDDVELLNRRSEQQH